MKFHFFNKHEGFATSRNFMKLHEGKTKLYEASNDVLWGTSSSDAGADSGVDASDLEYDPSSHY